MKLVADEGMERNVVEKLREVGHDVIWIAELSPSIPDEEVLRLAYDSDTILITEDKDFGELVYRRRLAHAGVVLVRLDGLPNSTKAEIVVETLQKHEDALAEAFTVITPDSVRIRLGIR